ncbi:MAG TPA: hypothetical protein VL523_03190, partial [Terriglobia bacterium]|nr:hypothetical protein [Terriglobia bacterium]
GEDAESEKIDSLEGLRSRQSSGAGAKPQSEALNWILFAVICAALILAAIAVMTLFMAHPGPPAR